MKRDCTIKHLINIVQQILLQVLEALPTLCLLELAPVSRRFQIIIDGMIEDRIRHFHLGGNFNLLLDWYEPAKKDISPYYECSYIATDGLDIENDQTPCTPCDNGQSCHQERSTALFSRYRPEPVQEPASASFPGRIKLLGNFSCVKADLIGDRKEMTQGSATTTVTLEKDEDFVQFVVRSEMAMHTGFRQAYARTMLMQHNAVVRLTRGWLEQSTWEGVSMSGERCLNTFWIDDDMTFGLKMAARRLPRTEPHTSLWLGTDESEVFEVTLEGRQLSC